MESRIYLRVRFPTESGNLVDPHFFHKVRSRKVANEPLLLS